MPYRKLPKTDESRLKSLKAIVTHGENHLIEEHILERTTIHKVQNAYAKLQEQMSTYKQLVQQQRELTTKHQAALRRTRLFISHFIQVLNLAIIRGEVRKKQKSLYKLSENDYTVPELALEEQVITWGNNIISGECERLKNGEVAIHNPSITKVAVQYDILSALHQQKSFQKSAIQQQQFTLSILRQEVDEAILSAWNEIEEAFKSLPNGERLAKCAKYGIIHYYRKGEHQDPT